MARQRGGKEYVITSNVVGAAFNHLAARPADDVRLPDPQLHTHVVLLNMTRRPDGQLRSLDPMQIFGAQDLGSAIYRAELARTASSFTSASRADESMLGFIRMTPKLCDWRSRAIQRRKSRWMRLSNGQLRN